MLYEALRVIAGLFFKIYNCKNERTQWTINHYIKWQSVCVKFGSCDINNLFSQETKI